MALSQGFLSDFNDVQEYYAGQTGAAPIGVRYERNTLGQTSTPRTAKVSGDLGRISMPNLAGGTAQAPTDATAEAIKAQTEQSAKALQYQKNSDMALAGANFLIQIANANNAYNATVGQAQLNIMQTRNQTADALYRGRQAQLDRQSEGYNAGQDALLSAAARGQDVGGAAVGKIQGSYEAMGVFNGMREEINSIREALGYELEEVGYEYQIDNAGIARQNAYVGAGLELGAKAGLALI